MAVTVTREQFFEAIREFNTAARTDLANEADRHIAAASTMVDDYAPDAPEAVARQAALLLAVYWFDSPAAPVGMRRYRALHSCGAAGMLQPYRKRRAATVAKSTNGSS